MDFDTLVQTFGNGFFPIIAYAAMFYYMVKKDEDHKEEVAALKDSLNANTQALTELRDLINFLGKKEQ